MLESTKGNQTEEVTMSTPFPYHLTDQSLTFYVEGRPTQVLRDHPQWDEIVKAVQVGDEIAVELSKPIVKIFESLEDLSRRARPSVGSAVRARTASRSRSGASRWTAGLCTATSSTASWTSCVREWRSPRG